MLEVSLNPILLLINDQRYAYETEYDSIKNGIKSHKGFRILYTKDSSIRRGKECPADAERDA